MVPKFESYTLDFSPPRVGRHAVLLLGIFQCDSFDSASVFQYQVGVFKNRAHLKNSKFRREHDDETVRVGFLSQHLQIKHVYLYWYHHNGCNKSHRCCVPVKKLLNFHDDSWDQHPRPEKITAETHARCLITRFCCCRPG